MDLQGIKQKIKLTWKLWVEYKSKNQLIKEMSDELELSRYLEVYGGISATFHMKTLSVLFFRSDLTNNDKIEEIKLLNEESKILLQNLRERYPDQKIYTTTLVGRQ